MDTVLTSVSKVFTIVLLIVFATISIGSTSVECLRLDRRADDWQSMAVQDAGSGEVARSASGGEGGEGQPMLINRYNVSASAPTTTFHPDLLLNDTGRSTISKNIFFSYCKTLYGTLL